MHTRLLAFVFLPLFLVAGRAGAQVVPPETANVELGAMFWTPTPEITLTSDSFGGSVDFVKEFNIEDTRFREFRAVLKVGRKHKIRFSRVAVKYDESTTLANTISFEGRTFPAGTPADTNIEWNLMRIGYEWDFVARDYGFVGLVTELKYNKVTGTISNALGSATTGEQKVPVPTVGGIARGYLGKYVSFTGEFTGFSLDREEFRGKFYDFDVYAQLNLVKSLAGQVGYRSVSVDYLVDGDAGVLKLKGPYFGGVLRF
ncbi:MAG: hypothetical protein ABL993_11025 [Vicinamibacterales bacterium]